MVKVRFYKLDYITMIDLENIVFRSRLDIIYQKVRYIFSLTHIRFISKKIGMKNFHFISK
jgi:hypothetical protein